VEIPEAKSELVHADDEIEITAEMVSAGADELDLSFDPFDGSRGLLTSRDIARAVFIAMMRARRPKRRIVGA
jgi:hypothetical protein